MELLSSIWPIAVAIVTFVWWCHKKKQESFVNSMAERLERNLVDAQDQSRQGAVSFSFEQLQHYKMIKSGEEKTAKAALKLLCEEGKLEWSGGRYYIKGYANRFK